MKDMDRIHRISLFLASLLLFLVSCSHSVEPGLYQMQDGFLRVGLDSLGREEAVLIFQSINRNKKSFFI